MGQYWELLCVGATIAVLTATAAGDAAAHGMPPQTQTAVEIVDRTEGRVLPIYWHDGRRYVVGKPGNEYAIRVRNGGAGRILAVMSVDGVNAISGDTASPQQSGYVLSPYESAEIAGWRTSLSRTAAFYFTSLPDSYAARTGRPDNVGVIGFAVFGERARPIALGDARRKDAAADEAKTAQAPAPAPASPAASARNEAAGSVAREQQSRLGTGYGRGETSYASYTQFERATDAPAETIAIYYDSYENLLAQGVPVAPPALARFRANPFPDAGRFVPDPRAQ
jgi:pyruvate/2-oxoglutarate dehydrogenase complex dihydrolipoamide acyltransferase (E2) component